MPGPPTYATRPSITMTLRWSKWPKSLNRQSTLRSWSSPSRSRNAPWFATTCDAAGHHRVVERLRAAARLAECRLRDDPDVDALADLPDQQVAEAVADLARLEAEDEDVDVGRRRLDVGEHRRKERGAVDQEVPARRDGRLEIERQAGPGRRPAERLLDGQTSVARSDEPGRRGPPEDQPPARDHRRGSGRAQEQEASFHPRKSSGPGWPNRTPDGMRCGAGWSSRSASRYPDADGTTSTEGDRAWQLTTR